MNNNYCRVLTKQRLTVLSIILAIIIIAIYSKFHYIKFNYYKGYKSTNDQCFDELTATQNQLSMVTEYKNRIDKLLTEMERKQKVEKDNFRDIMDNCIAMKQQSVICESQFDDLQSECMNVREDYNKLKQELTKTNPV